PNAPLSWWRRRCGDGDDVGGGGCGVVSVWRGDSGGGLWCRQRGDDGSHGGATVVVTAEVVLGGGDKRGKWRRVI
nr:hypothetical protein [Tanacetum cinerariifolium]